MTRWPDDREQGGTSNDKFSRTLIVSYYWSTRQESIYEITQILQNPQKIPKLDTVWNTNGKKLDAWNAKEGVPLY